MNVDNVSSKQICMIRAKLREVNAYMIMGKNTLMKACLNALWEEDTDPVLRNKIEKITGQLKGNINVIFTNGDLGQIKDVLDSEVRPSPAKAGMIAPSSVSIPAGPTGLDPKQTAFFQNLQIQTKIVKAQIEIVAPKEVIKEGDKVDGTQALLLDKLKIYPFSYKMHIHKILQDGQIFEAKVLALSNSYILQRFRIGSSNLAKLSLGAGVPSAASAPHSMLNAFKNLLAVSAESGYEFKEAQAFLQAAKNAPAAGAATAGATKVADAPVVEEKKEEVEDVDMGGLFGGDDEY